MTSKDNGSDKKNQYLKDVGRGTCFHLFVIKEDFPNWNK